MTKRQKQGVFQIILFSLVLIYYLFVFLFREDIYVITWVGLILCIANIVIGILTIRGKW